MGTTVDSSNSDNTQELVPIGQNIVVAINELRVVIESR